MEGGVKQPDGSEWPVLGDEERILYNLLFYSQGPVDGYILGEDVRDLFLKSGLSLRVLSQIWNLADVSNDNVLNVHEFALVMHLIRGLLKGLKAPPTLPRKLTPPKTPPVPLPTVTPVEKEVYTNIFHALDVQGKGVLDGDCCRHVFEASGLTSEVLSDVWNLSDVTRDGQLDLDEFCVACHLLRFVRAGHSISGPMDVFTELHEKVATQSLRARKRRVQQYEQHKQKLMSLKEKRRQQVIQENKRLQLQEEKLDLLRQVYKAQKKSGRPQITEEQFSLNVAKEKEEIENLEEIVYKLKKEHEKVRQETVKIILAEQKLNTDIITIKKDTEELNKRLGTCHTHATKDPDPFHQLYEQRKEKRQGSTIKDLDKIDVALPFTFNPFDPGLTSRELVPGAQLFAGKGNNHGNKGEKWQAVMDSLAGFGEGFDSLLLNSASSSAGDDQGQGEEDPVFKEVSVSMEERWLGLQWGVEEEGVFGLNGPETEDLQEKLFTLRAELQKLNEPGSRLLFKNPDDYLARKRAREEEEKERDRSRSQRRSLTERRSVGSVLEGARTRVSADNSSPRLRDRAPRDRHSYTERNEQVSQAVREYRQKRQSLQSVDSSLPHSANSSASSSPKEPRRSTTTKTSLSSASSTATESPREDFPVATEVVREVPEKKSEILVTTSVSSSGSAIREEQPVLGGREPEQATSSSAVSDFSAASVTVGIVSEAPKAPKAVVANVKQSQDQQLRPVQVLETPQTSVVDKQQITTIESKPKQPSVSIQKETTQKTIITVKTTTSTSNTVEQQQVVQQSESAQRSTSPESGPGISQTRPSSKKTRAPPPPPDGPSITPPGSSVARPPAQDAGSASAGRQGSAPNGAPPAGSKQFQTQIEQSRTAPVQSQPPPAQSSPDRPARPKRRKESSSSNTSNPSSPRDVVVQPPLQEKTVVSNVQVNNVSVVASSPSELLQLSENSSLEEEAPPAHGTVITKTSTTKTTIKSSQKEKPANKTGPGSAKDSVPPLLLNTNGQPPASTAVSASSEPVKQKRRKGKAPEPPSSSSGTSPCDAPLSPTSSTSSPTSFPRPAEDTRLTKVSEEKVERRKSSKTKAPPPPEQPRSNSAPKAVQDSVPFPKVTQEAKSTPKIVPESYPEPKIQKESNPAPKVVPESNPSPKVTKESVKPSNNNSPEPQPAVISASVRTTTPTVPPLSIADQKLENVEVVLTKDRDITKDLTIFPERADKDSDRGRLSETSSAYDSDADSLPPPLPNSAPPPLPSSPPPSQLPPHAVSVEEEVVEVSQVAPTHTLPPVQGKGKMEEGVLLEFDSMLPDTLPDTTEDPQKSLANLRAQFFGLNTANHSTSSNNNTNLLDLDDLGGHTLTTNRNEDSDSDVSSDERGMEGTFSPGVVAGDSGVILSSLPTSPDDGDGRIQLISYTSKNIPTTDTTTTIITTTTTQRPQSLPMKESLPTSTGDTLSPSSANLVSAQDMAALSPGSREIFEKARHFAEMVQKPNPAAKRGEEVGEGEDVPKQTMQDLELERRAVISLSTVRRKEVREVLSPPPLSSLSLPPAPAPQASSSSWPPPLSISPVSVMEEEMVVATAGPAQFSAVEFQDVKEPAAAGEQSISDQTQDSYTDGRGNSAEARWNEKSDKVNLYSENVVQEPESTEVVDRESIANLATTRRQWEAIFTSEPKDEPASKPKKNPPKWQVRMPYAEKTAPGPATASSSVATEEPESPPPITHASNMADTESAIEREIRLAMEREEMLKQEQEERLRQASQHSQGKMSSMESSTESELQPTFHELAEADRGSEFIINDRVHQQEDAAREESLQRGFTLQKFTGVSKSDDNPTESIIEREIRLQREREAELAMQRGGRGAPPVNAEAAAQRQRAPSPQHVQDDDDDVVDVVIEEIPYEEAISRYNHEGESRIAQELRELREREEEVRQLRERMSKAAVSGGDKAGVVSSSSPAFKQSSKSAPQTPRGDKSAPTTPRVDKSPAPGVSFSRSVHASPRVDTSTPPQKNQTPTPKPETPIEREIRLARERENELRRAKGLPELKPEPQKQESFDDPGDDIMMTPRYHTPQPDNSMRRFASNRLQQEMLDQRNREMKLRQEGKIISTSEEHIQPLKYTEVVGEDRTDGAVKRNFKTPGRRNSNSSQDELTSGENTPRSHAAATATPREGGSSKKAAGTGAVSFSYREFAQTAESKIERELREMREREEELRKQRSGGAAES